MMLIAARVEHLTPLYVDIDDRQNKFFCVRVLGDALTPISIPKHQSDENANEAELFSSRRLGLRIVTLTSRWYGECRGICR